MKKPVCAAPAMHHTMSGLWPLFQVMASATTRAAPSGSATSADMYWKRWVLGDAAEAWELGC